MPKMMRHDSDDLSIPANLDPFSDTESNVFIYLFAIFFVCVVFITDRHDYDQGELRKVIW